MKLKDRVAIITGSGRNIGEAIANLFAAEGAKIVVVDMDEGRGRHVADEIRKSNHDAIYVKADVSDESDVENMVKATVDAFGKVDILVNNVAISDRNSILETTLEDWNKVMAVCVTSQFLCAKHVGRQMVKQGHGGKIVNIGSSSGHRGRPGATAYQVAKGACHNLTKVLAVQLAEHNIRVNMVSPNKTGSPVGRDEFDPDRPVPNLVGRAGLPEEQAQVVLFLASDDSSFVVGANIFCDGGVMSMVVG